jgi:hypothetical protein
VCSNESNILTQQECQDLHLSEDQDMSDHTRLYKQDQGMDQQETVLVNPLINPQRELNYIEIHKDSEEKIRLLQEQLEYQTKKQDEKILMLGDQVQSLRELT